MKLRDKIMAINDIKTEDVTIPEWDGAVIRCKTMTGLERAEWANNSTNDNGKVDMSKMFDVILTNTFDPETGEPVFELADRDALVQKSAAALTKLQETIFRLSGLDKDAAKKAEKN